ncbi:chemotaxis protein CheA [Marinospirillum sp.]|uniref:chemotaxis protein CheA n=1 Tax=Marinospirillum sp. TaxID=2183934 RepID=UPI00384A8300
MLDAVQVFQDEAAEHLANLEEALLLLEENPRAADQIASAFRAMHTIKGSAGMVGYDHLSYFTHHLETFFDEVRADRVVLNEDLIALVLESKDHIEYLLTTNPPSPETKLVSEALIQRLAAIAPSSKQETPAAQKKTKLQPADEKKLYRLDITPDADSFRQGFDLLPVIRELEDLGHCEVSTSLNKDFDPDAFDPETCSLQVTVLLTSEQPEGAIQDVFMFVVDDWSVEITELDEEKPETGNLPIPEQQEPIAKQQQESQAKKTSEPTLKVPQGKLDQLMDQVGELVILQAYLDQWAQNNEDEQLQSIAEELDRLSSNLRDTVFDIRMLPIGSTFGRFRRLVRDLSKDLGKQVRFITEGAETELDKVVLDRLGDPLVHLLRNSLDHGIEDPQTRLNKGKLKEGTLKLLASHNQGQIQISISDDGAGLNTERLLEKALEKGLVSEDQELDDRAIHQLIFEPGFSTAKEVTDVSGRGVGMDVVRSSIEGLQGRISIESTPDQGTRLNIFLPMTLAIIDGLMVTVGEEYFIVPLSSVEECIETRGEDLSNDQGARLIKHRQQLLPCLRLREFFHLRGTPPVIEQTVILRSGEHLGAITVDQVIGQFQTVIKNLGQLYRRTTGVMGATVMGNGGIAMILDVAELLQESDQ